MYTTIMKDSEVGDEWIKQICAANPPQFVTSAQDGKQTQAILTGPVRLAFCDALLTPKAKMTQPQGATEIVKIYSCVALFPPIVDLSIFHAEWHRIAQQDFPNTWNGSMFAGLDPAMRAQAEKAQFAGFTPGGYFMTLSSNYKPPVVDARMNPIVNENQVHAGVWAIISVNAYASGKNQIKKGPRFGLQTVMIIAEDKNLEGAPPDPRTMFAGAKITPPAGSVSAAFNQAPQMQGMHPPQFGQASIGQIYGAPPAPQQQYAPPAPQAPAYDPDAAALAAMMGTPYPQQ